MLVKQEVCKKKKKKKGFDYLGMNEHHKVKYIKG
jgi:hypothetical protein